MATMRLFLAEKWCHVVSEHEAPAGAYTVPDLWYIHTIMVNDHDKEENIYDEL